MKKFINDESGATAIEYGLLAALMGIVLVVLVPLFGDKLTSGFVDLGESFRKRSSF
jgi:pilus assembly protein Flp/PilA